MNEIRLYTTPQCGYCRLAKALFDRHHLAYREIDVSGDPLTRARLLEMTGRQTVPQIFIGSRAIGGYEELSAIERAGRLLAMVGDSPSPDPEQAVP
jgi:glutaredoxin 3